MDRGRGGEHDLNDNNRGYRGRFDVEKCCDIRVAQWEAKAGYSTNFSIFHCSSSFHAFSCSILPRSSMLYSCLIA